MVAALLALVVAAPVRAEPALASASGHAMAFGPAGGPMAGLEVFVVEDPALATTTAGDGSWTIDGLPVGAPATFALRGDARYPIQTATFTVPAEGLERVTFQSPSLELVGAFEQLLGIESRPDRCHLATTVTRAGYSLYGGAPDGTHGEPGATVTIEPTPAAGGTPIYFNGIRFDTIWPDPALDATTPDGGVLFANVTPGTYILRAHKQGAAIAPVTVRCIAGTLTNASPPWGLQVTSGGLGPTDTVPFGSPSSTTTTSAPDGSTTTVATGAVASTTSTTSTVAPPGSAVPDPARPISAAADYAG